MSPDFKLPPTRYAESDGLSIAYQVFGAGIGFDESGIHSLKGVPGEWRLWRALDTAAAG